MIEYRQCDGLLTIGGIFAGNGYSGRGDGRNNGGMQSISGVGPLPRGMYRIGEPYYHARLGPLTFDLTPEPGTNTYGRMYFRIHGDNASHDASHGCIVLGPAIRAYIRDCGDRELRVYDGS